jgi:chromosome segregation ATPase
MNNNMEYNEIHAKEYEEEQMAIAEVQAAYDEAPADLEDYIPTQEEINDALLYDIRDNIGTMSDAQKGYLKQLVDETMAASTPKERLYNEILELQDRISKLDEFMRKRNEDGVRLTQALRISEAGLLLMQMQLEKEKELNDILVARYSIFDVKKGE